MNAVVTGEQAGGPAGGRLLLRVIECDGVPTEGASANAGKDGSSRTAVFVPPGATIGRGNDNHLVLPDPSRQISRLQASLRIDALGASIRNHSSVCAMSVNGEGLSKDEDRPLKAGDVVQVGFYVLRAESGMQETIPLSPLPAEPNEPLVARAMADRPASIEVQGSGSLSPAPAAFLAQPQAHGPVRFFERELPPLPVGASMREEATLPGSLSSPPPQPLANDAFWDSLVAEFKPAAPPAAFQPAPQMQAPMQAHLAASPAENRPATLESLAGLGADPLSLFADLPDEPGPLFASTASILADAPESALRLFAHVSDLAPQANHSAAIRASFITGATPTCRPEPVSDEPAAAHIAPRQETHLAPPVPPPASEPVPARPPADSNTSPVTPDACARAFLEGLGWPADQASPDPGQFRLAGELLNGLIGGTMALLASRTIVKREVKADVTQVLERENNPLKLLPDPNTVVRQMLGPPFPGFMTPLRALDDSFADLQAHQIGMLAGMRAALNQLLRSFSPARVEREMVQAGWLERLRPRSRQARAWQHYCALHAATLAAVEDDFHEVFGQTFLAAYDAEIARFHRHRAPADT
ncbi:type VI secretion system-associated FHA domain protein TagH [Niveibacterium sp. SC-1]|uniref:type VI secretion system-associated FHA domain protein TagH n=1 Tax=Niveibacterium sp. SC-1 TaxID=3135646 RepID=UPI00311F723C